jgi:predicted nucleic acid-binding protein
MITAVDTNVLLDVFTNDPERAEASANLLRQCIAQGQLVVCDIVWAELAAAFPTEKAMRKAMQTLGVEFSPLNTEGATLAGLHWRKYRRRGGKPRRVVADFLIGAHAALQAERLATRDRGFYRDYFAGLNIAAP